MDSEDYEIDPRLRDFRNFLFLMWAHLGLPAPTFVQYDISQYLSRGPRRRMIQAFRGVGKSWITAAFVIWRLYLNPNERILVVSASKDRADAFSIFVKRVIAEWPLVQHLMARPGQRDSNVAFDVGPSEAHQAPSVRSVGISGQLTGGRATIIVADDVEVPGNSLTQLMRDQLSEKVKEFDAVLVPGGEVIYLGTPQTEMSIYNDLPARGYEVRVWPARYPKDLNKYGSQLAPSLLERMEADPTLVVAFEGRGAPTEPARFHDVDLMEREASYGRGGFALQFMLDTSLSDADKYPLRTSDLIVMSLDKTVGPVKVAYAKGPDQLMQDLQSVGLKGDRYYRPMYVSRDFTGYAGVTMYIDPSGRGADETSYACVAQLNGQLYVLEVGGFRDGYSDATMQSLAEAAKRNGVRFIRIEPNYGGGMFDKLFAPWLLKVGYPCTIDDDPPRSVTQKERRIIDTLEPLISQHRLVVDRKVIEEDLKVENRDYQLMYQLTRITRDKGALRHDDRLEALAGACAYFVELMAQDQRKVEEDHRKASLEAWQDGFLNNVSGGALQLILGATSEQTAGGWLESNGIRGFQLKP